MGAGQNFSSDQLSKRRYETVVRRLEWTFTRGHCPENKYLFEFFAVRCHNAESKSFSNSLTYSSCGAPRHGCRTFGAANSLCFCRQERLMTTATEILVIAVRPRNHPEIFAAA